MYSFWNTISQLCQLRLTCYFLISCRYRLQLQARLFLLILSFMFAHVTPINHAIVGSIATNQTCTEMVKSRTSAPVIKCVAVRANQELRGVLALQQEVVSAFPPMILAAQVFSSIRFLKEDLGTAYGHTIWMTMIHFLSSKQLALK